MKKQNKSIRKHFRFTEQVASLLEEYAERTGKTENNLVATIIFAYLSDNKNFITCPEAGPDAWIKEEVPVMEGLSEFQCSNGARFWYDWEKEKVVKWVK
jgi:hypothetical protein